jgi:dihydrolipoamide dehydrogenase
MVDVVILGGGPGGYVAAMRAAQLGMSVALIEREALGGICVNWGCIPSKAILRSAEVLQLINNAQAFGIRVGDVQADYTAALKRARTVAERQVKGVSYLMRKYQVEVVRGTGRLVASNRVRAETAEGPIELQASKGLIIATGSRVRWVPGLQPNGKRIISSREVWNVEQLPKSIVLLGGGPIGCEFATVYNAFGVQVTLVEMLPRLLPREDPDCSAVLTKEFTKRGITVLTGMILDAAEVHDGGVRVRLAAPPPQQPITVQDWDITRTSVTTASQQPKPVELDVERVMLSAGFAPNSEHLGLEEVGVKVDGRGFIAVDDHMRTSAPGVYAIGDVTGKLALAHVAEAQGQVAAEAIAGQAPFPLDYNAMPRATYSDPQVASLGLLEEEAQRHGIRYQVVSSPFLPNGKARSLGETVGHVKLLVAEPYGEIIGAYMVGPEVTELIHELTLARTLEATPLELGRSVHAHPSLSEVVAEAALEWAGMPIAS